MSCFLLPKYLCDELNKMIASFWWNNCDGNRKIDWFSWDKLCLPKSDEGLGLHHFYVFNLALLAKQAWRIMINPQSLLARVLKAKYFPYASFLEAPIGTNASRDVIKWGARWQIDNGSNVRIWGDPWIDLPSFFRIFTPKPTDWSLEFMGELIDWDCGALKRDILDSLFSEEEIYLIHSIPISIRDPLDRLIWLYDPKGCFLVKSAYHVAREWLTPVNRSASSSLART